tara:strand:+ start:237 stop:395 length:159 start_codon:yes stop_codon:yes gene_type:complete
MGVDIDSEDIGSGHEEKREREREREKERRAKKETQGSKTGIGERGYRIGGME